MEKIIIENFHHRSSNNLYINCRNLDELVQERLETIFNPHKLNFFCVQLIVKGEGKYSIDFNPVNVFKNQVLVVAKNQIGQFNKPLNYDAKILIFTEDFFCIDELHFQFFYTTNLFNLSTDLAILEVKKHYNELFLLFELIRKELDKDDYLKKQQVLNNYLFNVLLLLEDCIDQSKIEQLNVSNEKYLVSSFKSLVNSKLDKSISIKQYATELNLNVRSIQYAFKKIENKTPYQWICERMLMEIKRCLLFRNITINEIAHFLGFGEPNHLTVFFKKQTGMTPLQFRNSFK